MYGDARSRVGAGARRSLSPTRNMRSRKNRGDGCIGVGDENNNSTINSPDPKKKGMFYFYVYGVCILCCL